ncbi:hypothetical protein CDPG_00003 [Cellulophaga phage phi47:1]|nr:hypothetical protein CDPG_00003 [Cellulophaga phage phi47:1]
MLKLKKKLKLKKRGEPELPEYDLALVMQAVEEFDDVEEYEEHLSGMSAKGLIKHINKHKMPVSANAKMKESEIVNNIITFIERATDSVVKAVNETDVVEEEVVESSKKQKKAAKSSKKRRVQGIN